MRSSPVAMAVIRSSWSHSAPASSSSSNPASSSSSSSSHMIMRVATVAIMVAASYNLSFLLESVTAALFGFRSLTIANPPPDRGDLIRHARPDPTSASSRSSKSTSSGEISTVYETLASHSPPDLPSWDPPHAPMPSLEVPVVFYYGRPGDLPCSLLSYVPTVVRQALKHNRRVHFVGPRECRQFFYSMGVAFEEYAEYEEVYEWFLRNLGTPVHVHVRWFVLKALMERHNYPRVFHAAPEVMLFANVSQVAAWMFPHSHMVLPVRWPSLRPPLRAHQYPSAAVGTHVALMSYAGLVDWCLFLHSVFRLGLFGGDRDTENLVLMPQYNDIVVMGWYTFPECWQQSLRPPCVQEQGREMTPEIGAPLLQAGARPKFAVHSFCQPRRCHNTSWSDEGHCAFDNNFSISTRTKNFRFRRGAKCPTSTHFAFYESWVGEPQKVPVQFLGVHFHGKERDFLTDKYPGHPETTWGSASD